MHGARYRQTLRRAEKSCTVRLSCELACLVIQQAKHGSFRVFVSCSGCLWLTPVLETMTLSSDVSKDHGA